MSFFSHALADVLLKVLPVDILESNIRSLADVLYHDETRVSSGESVHRRGLEGEVDILLEGIPPSPSNPLRCTDSPEDTLVSS
jgi:hypothetical protein